MGDQDVPDPNWKRVIFATDDYYYTEAKKWDGSAT